MIMLRFVKQDRGTIAVLSAQHHRIFDLRGHYKT